MGDDYLLKRLCMFGTAFFAMSTAWAFLIWGEWEFYGHLFAPIFGRVVFAILASLVAAILIMLLGSMKKGHAKVRTSAIAALSLLSGWAWEACFDEGVDKLVEVVSHPAP